jgi:hypothetical protein
MGWVHDFANPASLLNFGLGARPLPKFSARSQTGVTNSRLRIAGI